MLSGRLGGLGLQLGLDLAVDLSRRVNRRRAVMGMDARRGRRLRTSGHSLSLQFDGGGGDVDDGEQTKYEMGGMFARRTRDQDGMKTGPLPRSRCFRYRSSTFTSR